MVYDSKPHSPQAALWRNLPLEAHGVSLMSQPNHYPDPTASPEKNSWSGFFCWKAWFMFYWSMILWGKESHFQQNCSAHSLRPKKLTVLGGKWLAFPKNELPKIETQNTRKKKPVPNHRPLYGVFYTKKRGYCKRHTHQADGSAKSADDWGPIEKLMKQMGMDPVALALCRKSACGWWRFVCFFFAHKFWPCKKSIGNELEYLFGGNFWIFLGNRRRKRVLDKSWWLPQKKQRTWKGSGPRTSTSLV